MIRTTVVVEVAEGAMLLEVRPSPAAVVQAEHAEAKSAILSDP